MKGFLGAFLRDSTKRTEKAGIASTSPHGASERSDSVSTQPTSSGLDAGYPAPGHECKHLTNTEPSPERKVGFREDAAGQMVWDENRAAALVAEVDRLIEKEVGPGGAANTEARRRVLKNDGSIVRRLQQARDPFLWEWPEATLRLLARWAAWDNGRPD